MFLNREDFKDLIREIDAKIKGGMIPDVTDYFRIAVEGYNIYKNCSMEVMENDIKEALDS